MRDGEDPATERGVVVGEVGKPAHHCDEHVAEQVFGLGGTGAPEVPEHRGGEIAVEGREALVRLQRSGSGPHAHEPIVRPIGLG